MGRSYSKQRAQDAAVEKIGAIAEASAKAGTISEDLRKVLGVEKRPKVNLPPPINLSSPERFDVIVTDWEGAIGAPDGSWTAIGSNGRKIHSSELSESVRKSAEASMGDETEFWGQSLLSSLRSAKSEEKVLVILAPRLDPMLKIISEASMSGGAGEFIGVNVVVVAEKENSSAIREAFGTSGVIAHSTSY